MQLGDDRRPRRRRPARRSDRGATQVTSRPHVSLLRTVTSTSVPSARSEHGRCSMPPRHRRARRRPPTTCQAAWRAVAPGRPAATAAPTSCRPPRPGAGSSHRVGAAPRVDDHLPSAPTRTPPAMDGRRVQPTASARRPAGAPARSPAAAGRPAADGRRHPRRVDVRPADGGDSRARSGGRVLAQRASRIAAICAGALVATAPSCAGLSRRERRWAFGAGVLLAAALRDLGAEPALHLGRLGHRASSRTQPVWVALIARATGHDVAAPGLAGHRALAGRRCVVLTGVDFSLDAARAPRRPARAAGRLFAALYTVAGAEVRRTVSTTSYTALCYAHVRRRAARRLPRRRGSQLGGLRQQDLAAAARADRSARSCSGTRCSTGVLRTTSADRGVARAAARGAGGRADRGVCAAARRRRWPPCPPRCCCCSGIAHRHLVRRRRRGAVGRRGVTRRLACPP